MFISDEEANRRLNTSENVLTRVNGGDIRSGIPHVEEEPPIILPDEILDSEDAQCNSAREAGVEPAGRILQQMLGMKAGRKPGQKNLDPAIRAAAGACAQLTTLKNAGAAFEVSHLTAGHYAHGYTNQAARYDDGVAPQTSLLQEIDRQKRQIRDLAFEKLAKTLGLISDDKIEAITDPLKLGRLARDLSNVHDKAMPREEREAAGGIHFHIWKPEMKAESDYEVVTVGSQR